MSKRATVFIALTVLLSAGVIRADIMPSFSNVPAGWSVDRYAPASFTNVGAFQGRTDVLGIQISSAGDLANRPGGYQYSQPPISARCGRLCTNTSGAGRLFLFQIRFNREAAGGEKIKSKTVFLPTSPPPCKKRILPFSSAEKPNPIPHAPASVRAAQIW